MFIVHASNIKSDKPAWGLSQGKNKYKKKHFIAWIIHWIGSICRIPFGLISVYRFDHSKLRTFDETEGKQKKNICFYFLLIKCVKEIVKRQNLFFFVGFLVENIQIGSIPLMVVDMNGFDTTFFFFLQLGIDGFFKKRKR